MMGTPQRVYYDPYKHVYAGGSFDTNYVFVFDTETKKFLFNESQPFNACLDIDRYKNSYYVVSQIGSMMIINTDEKKYSIRKLEIGTPYSIRINNITKKIYVSSWASGNMIKMNLETLEVEAKRDFYTHLFGMSNSGDTILNSLCF